MADEATLKVAANADQAKREFKKLEDRVQDFGDSAKGVAAAAGVAFAGMAVGIGASLKKAGDFQSQLRGVGKTTGISGKELDKLGSKFKDLSDQIPVSTKELLGIGQAAGQLGVTGSKNIRNFATTIAKLGSASDIQGEQAATALTRILNVTGAGIDQIDELGSVVVRMGNNFAATESEIVKMTTEVARSTAAFDTSYDQAVALGTAMKSLGIQAQLGGSAVGKSFRKIEKALNEGGEGLRTLEELTGQTADVLRKRFANDAVGVFQDFVSGLGDATKQGAVAAEELAKLGLKGDEVNKVLPVLAERSGLVGKALKSASDETKNATALNKEAQVAFNQFNSDLSRAGNAVGDLTSSLGKAFIPMARSVLQAVTSVASAFRQWFDDLSGTTQQIIAGMAAAGTAITGAVAAFGALAVAAGAAVPALQSFNTVILGTMVPALKTAFTTAAASATTAMRAFTAAIVANPIGAAITALVAALGGLWVAWKSNFLGIQQVTFGVFGAIKNLFTNFVETSKRLFRALALIINGALSFDFGMVKEGVAELKDAFGDQIDAAVKGYKAAHDQKLKQIQEEKRARKEQQEKEKQGAEKVAQAKREAHQEAMAQIKVNSQAIQRAQNEQEKRTEEQIENEEEARAEAARIRREREDAILKAQIRNVKRRTVIESESQEELRQGEEELSRLYEEQHKREVARIKRETQSEKVAKQKIKTAEFELAQKKKDLAQNVSDQKARLHREELKRIDEQKRKQKEAAREAARERQAQVRQISGFASDALRGGKDALARSAITAGANAYAPGTGVLAGQLFDRLSSSIDKTAQRVAKARRLHSILREEERLTTKIKQKELEKRLTDENAALEEASEKRRDLESKLQSAIREKRRQTHQENLEELKERTAEEREILQKAHDRRVALQDKLQNLLEKKEEKAQSEQRKKLDKRLEKERAVFDAAKREKERLEEERLDTIGQIGITKNAEERERLKEHLSQINADLKVANEKYIQAEKEFKKKDVEVRKELGIEQKKTLAQQIKETKKQIKDAKESEIEAQEDLKKEKLRIRKELGIEEREITKKHIEKLKGLVKEAADAEIAAQKKVDEETAEAKKDLGIEDKSDKERLVEVQKKAIKEKLGGSLSFQNPTKFAKLQDKLEELKSSGEPIPNFQTFISKFHRGGTAKRYHAGGQVARREVPAVLEENEEVIRRRSAIANRPLLKAINAANGRYQPPPSEVILRVEGEGAFARAVQESLITETAMGTGSVTVKTGSED